MQDEARRDSQRLYHVVEKPLEGEGSSLSPVWGDELPSGWDPTPRVVALGVFDGLHLGHRYLIDCAVQDALERSQSLLVVTFDRDPDEFFRFRGKDGRPEPFKLMRNADRVAALQQYLEEHAVGELSPVQGGAVLLLPTGEQLFGQPPEGFLDMLLAFCNPSSVHVGDGFRYGAKAAGTTRELRAWCTDHDVACNVHPLYESDGLPVSSTRIRGLLGEGAVAKAAELTAGRYHSIHGTVARGRGEGTGFGFATANLELEDASGDVEVPAEGVYACYCTVDGIVYPAAVNVGVAKSFAQATAPIEAHLLGFEGDLYGKDVEVAFVEWLRAPRVFETKDELISTVMGNIDWVRQNLGDGPLG